MNTESVVEVSSPFSSFSYLKSPSSASSSSLLLLYLPSMEFDLENPVPDTSSLFTIESDHMPCSHYVNSLKQGDTDFMVRQETISLVSQLCSNFDPMMSYLAVNYVDRFLSSHALPNPKPWMYGLLAASCVSLAAKILHKPDSSIPSFQVEGGLIYDAETLQRMEMLILGALKWRMRSITPISFLPLFIAIFKLDDPPLKLDLKARARHIIVKSQKYIKLLEFKPSVIAAAAVLSAARDLYPVQFLRFHGAICECSYVNKEETLRCYNEIQQAAMVGYESAAEEISSSDTPINVVDLHLCNSDHSSGSSSERVPKRRRIEEMIQQTVEIHN